MRVISKSSHGGMLSATVGNSEERNPEVSDERRTNRQAGKTGGLYHLMQR
jgi:hypothetical protein